MCCTALSHQSPWYLLGPVPSLKSPADNGNSATITRLYHCILYTELLRRRRIENPHNFAAVDTLDVCQSASQRIKLPKFLIGCWLYGLVLYYTLGRGGVLGQGKGSVFYETLSLFWFSLILLPLSGSWPFSFNILYKKSTFSLGCIGSENAF